MSQQAKRKKRRPRAQASRTARGGRDETIAGASRRVMTALADEAALELENFAKAGRGVKRVHAARSVLRRLEGMIGVLGCGFEGRAVERARKAVRRARQAAGEVRDLDVAAALLKGLKTDGASLAAAEDFVSSRRRRAFKELSAQGRAYADAIRARVRAMLDVPAGRRADLPAACAVRLALARGCEAMRDAADAGMGTPELLHGVRLNLKAARSTLELLGGSIGARASLATRARSLADALGEVNDLATLVELLDGGASRHVKRRAALGPAREAARRAHAAAHAEGVRRGLREAPGLARAIRRAAFGAGR
jgi:CHAD domain-containing protein